MKVGIICEGPTDFAVLEALALDLIDAQQCILLQPDFDRLRTGDSSAGGGWQNVRKFLQSSSVGLAIDKFDIVVIQVDASIRKNLKKLRASSAGEPELASLCDHVKGWAEDGLPASAVIALPREDIEAWLLAATTQVKNVEENEDPVVELSNRGIVGRRKDGTADKSAESYRQLSKALIRLAKERKERARVPELDRFVSKLESRARAAKKAAAQ